MTTILTTRPAGAADPLVARLSALGYRVAAVPTVVLEPVAAGGPLDAALARLADLDLIVVTSPAGADAVLEALGRTAGLRAAAPNGMTSGVPDARPDHRPDGVPDAPRDHRPDGRAATQGAPRCRWAAVGPGTAAVLEQAGIVVDVVAVRPSGRGLAAALGPVDGVRILLARTDAADRDLPDALRAAGAVVEEVVAYRTHEAPVGARGPLLAALADRDTRALVAASGSAIRGAHALLDDAGRDRLARLPIVSIGPTTSAVVVSLGLTVAAEATTPTLDGLVAAIAVVAPPPRPLRSEP